MGNGFKFEHITTGAVVGDGADDTRGAENATGADDTRGAENATGADAEGFVLLGGAVIGSKVAAFLKSSRAERKHFSYGTSVLLFARSENGCFSDAVDPGAVGFGLTDGRSAVFIPFEVPERGNPRRGAFLDAAGDYRRRYAEGLRITFDSTRFEPGASLDVFYNPSTGAARLEVRFKNGVKVTDTGTPSGFPDLMSVVPHTVDFNWGLLERYDASRLAATLAMLAEIVQARGDIASVRMLSSTEVGKPCSIRATLGKVYAGAVVMPLVEVSS